MTATVGYQGRPNGKIQDAWVPWVLSFITVGIYYLFWHYRINREMQENGIPVNPARAVLAIFPGGLIIVPALVSIYNTGQRINTLQEQRGMTPSANGWVGLLLNYVMSIGVIYYQSEINKAWRAGSEYAAIAQAPAGQPPAGWYPAPDGLSAQQYWDGTQWTEHRA